MKNIIVFLLFLVILSSCGPTASYLYADKRMKELNIGMDKSRVTAIMGKGYLVNSSSKDPAGNLTEVLVYKSSPNEEYRLKFLNGQLDSWERIHLREYLRQEIPPESN